MKARLLTENELVDGRPPMAPHMSFVGTWDNVSWMDLGRIVERKVEIGERLYIGRPMIQEIVEAVGCVTLDAHKQLRGELERERARIVQLEEQFRDVAGREREIVELTARAESAEQRERMLEQQLKEARLPKTPPLDLALVEETV